MGDSELHDRQPPPADSIGQVWTCPICGDPWRAEEGAPIGWRRLRMGSGWHRCEVEAPEHDDLACWPLILQRAKGGVRTNHHQAKREPESLDVVDRVSLVERSAERHQDLRVQVSRS
jgi:hypothetical protein